MQDRKEILDLTTDIVSAYVAANTVSSQDLPGLITRVFASLQELNKGETAPQRLEQTPVVPIKRSVTPEYIICLEDGKKFKSLRRHLMTKYGLTPEAYRAKWGLPADYPMVAPVYARQRSELAKRMGLGRKKAPKTDRRKRRQSEGQ